MDSQGKDFATCVHIEPKMWDIEVGQKIMERNYLLFHVVCYLIKEKQSTHYSFHHNRSVLYNTFIDIFFTKQ